MPFHHVSASLRVFSLFLLFLRMMHAEESQLLPDLKEQISEWRLKVLPAIQAKDYWSELMDLGSKVGEVQARSIETSGSSDPDSAIALMAYKAWSSANRIDEIAGWYGVYESQVSRELRGVDSDEHWERIQARFNAKHARFEVERLRNEHKQEGFRPAWEAWMLSPPSRERYIMRQRMSEALVAIGDDRSIVILVEKYRILPKQSPEGGESEERLKGIQGELSEVRRVISEIGGKSAVSALLECVRIAEAQGELGEGAGNVRKSTVHGLSRTLGTEYIEKMEAQFPDFHEAYGDPARPGRYLPVDDKWKEFKPIIEEMLKDPKDLREEEITLLQEALAAMPNE